MITTIGDKDDIDAASAGMNSARDMKVVDFNCFLNRRETQSKKRKERKSEYRSKFKNNLNKMGSIEDKDIERPSDEYIPVIFVK